MLFRSFIWHDSLSLVLAFFVHAAAVSFLLPKEKSHLGALPKQTAAISLNLVETARLQTESETKSRDLATATAARKILSVPQEQEKEHQKTRKLKRQVKLSSPVRTLPKKKKSPRLSASTGEIRHYGAAVRAQLARKRPGGENFRGVVVVSFTLSRSGRLREAKISRSSGNKALDRKAISAVRRASPFPKPPAGMTLRQLRYSIPFRYR